MIVGANMPWQNIDTESGLIMPWYTLSCLEWLKKQDVTKWNVFEYGAGYSSIWWRANCFRWYAVENNEKWALATDARLEQSKEEYVPYISEVTQLFRDDNNPWHCIIIDGAWRLECLQNSFDRVRQGGYIIIDNFGQEDFPHIKEAEELLVGWEKQLFKQPNHRIWVTAVFRKS